MGLVLGSRKNNLRSLTSMFVCVAVLFGYSKTMLQLLLEYFKNGQVQKELPRLAQATHKDMGERYGQLNATLSKQRQTLIIMIESSKLP